MKLGIIGYGRRLSGLLKHFRDHAQDFAVCGIVDRDPEAARLRLPEDIRESTKFFPSLADLVRQSKPDALAIGTRCDSHAALAIEAAGYGLPLFLEKPVAITLDQAIALETAFQKTSCPVLVSFPLRVTALCRRAKQLLDQEAVGPIEHILATNYVSYGNVYFDTEFRNYAVTQGLFLQKATHDFDYLMWLAGSPIVRVAGMSSLGRIYRDSQTKPAKPDSDALYFDDIGTPETGMNEDSSSALLEFANGAKGVYTQVFYSKRVPRRGASISGFRGLLEFDWYQNTVKVTRHREPVTDVSTLEGDESHFGGDEVLAENFIAMIREGVPSLAPLETGLRSVYACLAVKESVETGRFIDVRQLGTF